MSVALAAGIPIIILPFGVLDQTSLPCGCCMRAVNARAFCINTPILFLGLFRLFDHACEDHRVSHHFGGDMTRVEERPGGWAGAMLGPAKNTAMASKPEGVLGSSLSAASLAAHRFSSLGADTHRSAAICTFGKRHVLLGGQNMPHAKAAPSDGFPLGEQVGD